LDWWHSWPFVSSASVTVVLGCIGTLFFGALLASSVRANQRAAVPGLVLMVIASISEVLRGVLGSDLSVRPGTAGGIWRIVNAVLLVLGFVRYLRGRRRPQGGAIAR
jgi:hypothetical protein